MGYVTPRQRTIRVVITNRSPSSEETALFGLFSIETETHDTTLSREARSVKVTRDMARTYLVRTPRHIFSDFAIQEGEAVQARERAAKGRTSAITSSSVKADF